MMETKQELKQKLEQIEPIIIDAIQKGESVQLLKSRSGLKVIRIKSHYVNIAKELERFGDME